MSRGDGAMAGANMAGADINIRTTSQRMQTQILLHQAEHARNTLKLSGEIKQFFLDCSSGWFLLTFDLLLHVRYLGPSICLRSLLNEENVNLVVEGLAAFFPGNLLVYGFSRSSRRIDTKQLLLPAFCVENCSSSVKKKGLWLVVHIKKPVKQ